MIEEKLQLGATTGVYRMVDQRRSMILCALKALIKIVKNLGFGVVYVI